MGGRESSPPPDFPAHAPSAFAVLALDLFLPLAAFDLSRRLGHIFVKLTGRVGVLELDGTVGNAELVGEDLADSLSNSFTFRSRHIQNLNVTGKRMGA